MIKQIKCKLYLEGVEVPFSAVSINESVGSPAMAAVNLPVNDKFLFILPKTQMHLFYSDTGDAPYYLIFEGALSEVNFSKNGFQRSITAKFISHTSELGRSTVKQLETDPMETINDQFMFAGVSNMNYYGKVGIGPLTKEETENRDISTIRVLKYSDLTPVTSVLSSFILSLKEGVYSSLEYALLSLMKNIIDMNSYYKLLDNTLHMKDRMYVSSNRISDAFLTKSIALGLMENDNSRLPIRIPVTHILAKILNYLGYEWVDLAAPAYTGSAPVSLLFKPVSDYMLPVISNVIMPDEISSFSYSRNMEVEPTRLIMSTPPLMIGQNDVLSTSANFKSIAPFASFQLKDDGNPIMAPTSEEKRRGFNHSRGNVSSSLEALLADEPADYRTAGEKTAIPFVAPDMETPNVNDVDFIANNAEGNSNSGLQYMSMFAEKAFFDQRYANRGCNITTEYSPYRLIGFPALIVDKVLPAVYGTIMSLASTITADGKATQQIQIKSPKLISTIKDKTKPSDWDLFVNYIPQFPGIYCPESYSVQNIGKSLYKDIVNNDLDDCSSSAILDKDTKASLNDTTSVLIKTATILATGEYDKKRLEAMRKRKLITEKQFWDFIDRKEDGTDEYSVEGNDPNVQFSVVDSLGTLQITEPKPFVKERRDRVKIAMLNKGNLYNG